MVPFLMAALASFQEGNCLMVFHCEPPRPIRMTSVGPLPMLNDVHDLVSVAEDMKLPTTLEEVIPRKAYMVPMNMELLSSVQAVCFTGLTQIKWLLQLAATDFKYTMHIDGVHKLHHGEWILVTIGPHALNRADDGTVRKTNMIPYDLQ
jgi:hypothetical protein